MKLVYVTAGMGLHVMAISDAYYKLLGDNFCFVWTQKPLDSNCSIHKHAELGLSYNRPYIIHAWKSKELKTIALDKINNADVVICGGKSFDYVIERVQNNKITFGSSERWFKRPFYTISPRGWWSIYRTVIWPQKFNYYRLALGAYCANDLKILHICKDRVYKYGYFVPIEEYDIEECIIAKRRETLEIMWCARFIDWKHPELVIGLAKRLIDNGITNYHINMVGATSPLQNVIKKYLQKNNMQQYVTIIEGLPNAETRAMMKNSNIFLITSDRKEGWGAVLNEAMGAGCGIVASNQIGATPFLIKQRQNGLIFKSKCLDSLYANVLLLIQDQAFREKLAINAYNTISGDWAVDNAAKRFVTLAQSILDGNPIQFDDGPCSPSYNCDENKILEE